jgi:G3E family GTPase
MSTLPVTLLTGFLGAGKTTLVSKMLKDPRFSDTAVVINEFGEVALDHVLVEAAPEAIVEVTAGCLCCTVRGDIRQALVMLHARAEAGTLPLFSRLVIETTGLADPAPVIHTLMADPRLLKRYHLAQVVTVVDAVNGLATLNNHVEAVKQVAVADQLLLSKTDTSAISAASLDRLQARLKKLNPAAPLIKTAQVDFDVRRLVEEVGRFDPANKHADVETWLAAHAYSQAKHDHDHHHHDGHHHHDHDHHHHDHHEHDDHHHHTSDVNRHSDEIEAFCLTFDQPISRLAFSIAMELLSANQGEDLLRVKGLVALSEHPEQPVVIHAVQHMFHEPVRLERWPSEDRRTRLVFITRNIARHTLESFFASWIQANAEPETLAL